MNFTLGIFELFTYAIPGAMQLTFFAYLAARLNLIELADVDAVPGLVLAVGAAIASYLLGHLTYIVSTVVDRIYPTSRDGMRAWAAVARDAAEAGERAVPRLNSMLLLAGAELRDREVVTEIGRLRATGLMLRNAVIPTALGALVAIVEVITGPHRWLGLGVALLLCAASVGFAWHGRKLRYWAHTKTYQIAYWLDMPVGDQKGSGAAGSAEPSAAATTVLSG